jgi:hypothetical protein
MNHLGAGSTHEQINGSALCCVGLQITSRTSLQITSRAFLLGSTSANLFQKGLPQALWNEILKRGINCKDSHTPPLPARKIYTCERLSGDSLCVPMKVY